MWYTLKSGSNKTVIVQAENSATAIIKALDILKRQSDFKMYEVKINIVEVKG